VGGSVGEEAGRGRKGVSGVGGGGLDILVSCGLSYVVFFVFFRPLGRSSVSTCCLCASSLSCSCRVYLYDPFTLLSSSYSPPRLEMYGTLCTFKTDHLFNRRWFSIPFNLEPLPSPSLRSKDVSSVPWVSSSTSLAFNDWARADGLERG